MRAYLLSLFLLTLVAFSLATTVEPWFQSWAGSRTQSQNVIQVALGDSRKMFARHFFVKADAYFHNGYYPTVYDSKEGFDNEAIKGAEHSHDEEKCAEDFLGKPRDWIDAFSRNFYPARHTHLGDSGCGHSCCQRAKEGKGHDENCEHKDHEKGHDHAHDAEHDHDHDHDHAHAHDDDGHDHGDHEHGQSGSEGLEREILPWLRLSAEMDPQRIETYTVAAFWLRTKLGAVDAAEQFLREGLRANPGDPDILFGLGSIYFENRKDMERARNVLELAFIQWREREARKPEPNKLLLGQILNQLGLLEREAGNYSRAVQHYTLLKQVSPSKQAVQEWIDYLQTNQPPTKVGSAK